MAASVKTTFAELYRSAFAEPDPRIKQLLLQEVQSLIDAWLFEEKDTRLGPLPTQHPPWITPRNL